MTFTSLKFILFFPLVVLIYNILPRRIRMVYMLIVSYIVYGMLQPTYLLLLVLSSIVTYIFGIWIDRTINDNKKYRIMICGVIIILIPLFLFKYFNFLGDIISSIGVNVTFPTIKWILPVGISYYTFMSIGYLVDLYNEDVKAEKNPVPIALFLSFFPIVFSGPIERAGNMLPQFYKMGKTKYVDLLSGAKMMLWGYFMKLCVADRLGMYISSIYSDIDNNNGSTIGLAALLFPIQEYGDLAGYSLIAIGTAKCLGFNIIPNFKRPFFATSVSSFWHRWHMSLIQWLTDYIYTPMSYCLRSWKSWGIVASLMVTFFISGVWHGANMNCVLWGLMQGVLLSLEVFTLNKRTQFENKYNLTSKFWYTIICCLAVYSLFAFSEIYGMSYSLADANKIVSAIFSDFGTPNLDNRNLHIAFIMVILLLYKDYADEFLPAKYRLFDSTNGVIRYISLYIITMFILLFAVFDGGQFLYFQF